MVKRAIGLSIAALLIGTMIVIMVKSNIEQLEPIVEPLDIDREMEIAYRIISIPTTYIIGSDEKIGQQIVGPMDEDKMKNLVDWLE